MDREWIEKLLSRVDLVQIISRYVPLKKKGKDFWGCCPFHHEKEPSFSVSADKQFFYCYGCKESGNAISFIEKMESVDFYDAVKILAAEAKMELPAFSGDKRGDGVSREKRERLYSLMREAAKHYHANLSGPRGKTARDYLTARAIPKNLVVRFGFGASYDGAEIIRHLLSLGYTHAEMKEAGLIEQRGADWYDVFYGRLMIPIINNLGEVVAFGGRLITPETHIAIKYRNSTNTVIFDKSRNLYAINLLKKKKQRERIDYVIVVEGYMDVVALHAAGFDMAVASMGTALTHAQAKLLRNYSPNVYISYDGDSAGKTATLRGLDVLASVGLNVKVVSLPEGLDPDDLIKQKGKDEYARLLAEAETLPAFKINNLRRSYDLTTPDGKSAYAIEAMKVVAALENPVEREEYLAVVRDATGYSVETLRMQANLAASEEKTPVRREPPIEANAPPTRSRAELFVIASVAHGKEYVDYNEDVYPYLETETDREIYSYSLEKHKSGEKPALSVLFASMPSAEVAEVAEYGFADSDDKAKYKLSVTRLKVNYLTKEKTRLAAEYDKAKDKTLLEEIINIETALRGIINGDTNE